MTYLALLLLTALVLGMRHATDADHVIAVSAIIAREGSFRKAGAIGALWGIGHTATVAVVGGCIVLFRLAMSPELGPVLEGCVAVMLIVLGARNLLASRHHTFVPAVPPFLAGVVHGLAGSAAVALLVVPLIRDPLWAALYLAVFGVGTITGMTMLTCAIAGTALIATQRVRGADRWIRLGAGALSVVFGVALLYRVT